MGISSSITFYNITHRACFAHEIVSVCRAPTTKPPLTSSLPAAPPFYFLFCLVGRVESFPTLVTTADCLKVKSCSIVLHR